MEKCLPFSKHRLRVSLINFLWFLDNLQILADRLVGPFDIEDVVDPIGVKISDAIMNFQNSGYDVTTKVYEDCGTPRIQKRQVLYWHTKSLRVTIKYKVENQALCIYN